ncbi:hypothetical protein V6N12_024943 [Hibiscus sabdariffa]|uniref:DUF4283 domain-containing protein n=1 Tax=Hibiscus sabdariffa TaxID=183260 RepID=A0ABR2A4N6_9ROSI
MFGESCLPKKQRRRDEAPLDADPLSPTRAPAMVCDDPLLAPVTLPPTVSYKEAMMGDLAVETEDDNDLVPLEDDDIDLLDDDDVRVGVQDDTSFIDFSSRVQDLDVKSLEFALVVSVLGCHVGYSTLYNRLMSIWKPSKPIKLIGIENHHFLVKFSSCSDYMDAFTYGP